MCIMPFINIMVRLVNRTRNNDMIELGISPRGTVALAAMAKSCAWLRGRKFVYPDDVADIFYDVAIHRIRLNAKQELTCNGRGIDRTDYQ